MQTIPRVYKILYQAIIKSIPEEMHLMIYAPREPPPLAFLSGILFPHIIISPIFPKDQKIQRYQNYVEVQGDVLGLHRAP